MQHLLHKFPLSLPTAVSVDIFVGGQIFSEKKIIFGERNVHLYTTNCRRCSHLTLFTNNRKKYFLRKVHLCTAGRRSCCHLAHFFLTIAHSSKVYSILSEVDGFSFHCSALFTIQNPIHALGTFFSLHVSTSANVHTFSSGVILYSNVGLGSSLRGEPGLTTFRSQGCP